jgi:hypothetical protein
MLAPLNQRRVLLGALVCVLSAPAASQTPEKKAILPSPDVLVLAEQMPNCKEFRNACQVCARLPDGKLGCSNIGIACSPSGDWQCAVPAKAGEPKK